MIAATSIRIDPVTTIPPDTVDALYAVKQSDFFKSRQGSVKRDPIEVAHFGMAGDFLVRKRPIGLVEHFEYFVSDRGIPKSGSLEKFFYRQRYLAFRVGFSISLLQLSCNSDDSPDGKNPIVFRYQSDFIMFFPRSSSGIHSARWVVFKCFQGEYWDLRNVSTDDVFVDPQ